jgi:hypothetical protein
VDPREDNGAGNPWWNCEWIDILTKKATAKKARANTIGFLKTSLRRRSCGADAVQMSPVPEESFGPGCFKLAP